MAESSAAARQHLQALHAQLAERLQRLHEDRTRAAQPLSADFAEQAVERENDEVVDRLELATAADLQQLRMALERLDAGLYGVCGHCGGRIEAGRLRVLPQATTCAGCAAAAAEPSAERAGD